MYFYMVRYYISVIILILFQKTIVPVNLVLLLCLFVVIKSTSTRKVHFILYSAILLDLANNLVLGSSLLSFGSILLLVFLYQRFVAPVNLRTAAPTAILSLIAYQSLTLFLNKIV